MSWFNTRDDNKTVCPLCGSYVMVIFKNEISTVYGCGSCQFADTERTPMTAHYNYEIEPEDADWDMLEYENCFNRADSERFKEWLDEKYAANPTFSEETFLGCCATVIEHNDELEDAIQLHIKIQHDDNVNIERLEAEIVELQAKLEQSK